ncbi:hypothetical protein BDZ45DRAFT_24007 [Acephala macrosclerotiorum]|nr:hypothetical protein BDZ45DRAFT_24007 [Acephala macrosclerotiorum]
MAILSRKSKAETETAKKQEKGKMPERRPPSFTSSSTGTTVIGFTPPHEKSYPQPKIDRRPPSLDSDHTMVGFTPPHEKMIASPVPQPTSSEPRPTTKRSLPWLRRNEQSPEASPTKKMSITPPATEQQQRASTPLQGWVSTFKVADKPIPVEKEKKVLKLHLFTLLLDGEKPGSARTGLQRRTSNKIPLLQFNPNNLLPMIQRHASIASASNPMSIPRYKQIFPMSWNFQRPRLSHQLSSELH